MVQSCSGLEIKLPSVWQTKSRVARLVGRFLSVTNVIANNSEGRRPLQRFDVMWASESWLSCRVFRQFWADFLLDLHCYVHNFASPPPYKPFWGLLATLLCSSILVTKSNFISYHLCILTPFRFWGMVVWDLNFQETPCTHNMCFTAHISGWHVVPSRG